MVAVPSRSAQPPEGACVVPVGQSRIPGRREPGGGTRLPFLQAPTEAGVRQRHTPRTNCAAKTTATNATIPSPPVDPAAPVRPKAFRCAQTSRLRPACQTRLPASTPERCDEPPPRGAAPKNHVRLPTSPDLPPHLAARLPIRRFRPAPRVSPSGSLEAPEPPQSGCPDMAGTTPTRHYVLHDVRLTGPSRAMRNRGHQSDSCAKLATLITITPQVFHTSCIRGATVVRRAGNNARFSKVLRPLAD